MSTRLLIAGVVDEPLSVAKHEDAVVEKAHGAGGSFAGVVSEPGLGQSVTELQYVGPPTAGEVIRELAEEFTCDDVDAVAVTASACWAAATWRRLAHSAPDTVARPTSPARNPSMK